MMQFKEWFWYFRRICLKVFRKICWKHGILLKKICRRCFDNTLQKLFGTTILQNCNGQILLMVGLWLKLQMEIVDYNDSIFTRLPSLHISDWILRTVMHPSAEARTGPNQATNINLFARIVNIFKLTLWTVFLKSK